MIKDRRKLKNIAVNPRAQLRFFIPFMTLLILNCISYFYSYWSITHAPAIVNSDDVTQIEIAHYIASRISVINTWGLMISGSLCFGFWLVYSHRIFGPVVPILRQIDQLIEGNFDKRVHLRKHDELGEIAERLNLLAEKLEGER